MKEMEEWIGIRQGLLFFKCSNRILFIVQGGESLHDFGQWAFWKKTTVSSLFFSFVVGGGEKLKKLHLIQLPAKKGMKEKRKSSSLSAAACFDRRGGEKRVKRDGKTRVV